MKFSLLIAVFGLAFLPGCSMSHRMAGPYVLVKESCNLSNVRSSRLVLHSDGTYVQHYQCADGRSLDLDRERWNYAKGAVHLKNLQINACGKAEVATAETAKKADSSRPPTLTFPNSTCYYTGPK